MDWQDETSSELQSSNALETIWWKNAIIGLALMLRKSCIEDTAVQNCRTHLTAHFLWPSDPLTWHSEMTLTPEGPALPVQRINTSQKKLQRFKRAER